MTKMTIYVCRFGYVYLDRDDHTKETVLYGSSQVYWKGKLTDEQWRAWLRNPSTHIRPILLEYYKVPKTKDGLLISCPECGYKTEVPLVPQTLGGYAEYWCAKCGYKIAVEQFCDSAAKVRIYYQAGRRRPKILEQIKLPNKIILKGYKWEEEVPLSDDELP